MRISSIIFVFILISSSSSFGQSNSTETLSKAEKFSSKSGTLIEKEFFDVGKLKKTEIKVVKYRDLISNESVTSVKIELESSSSYSSIKIAVLDSDEIDALIRSINLIKNQIFQSTPSNYKEVTFFSRSGFEAGCFWSKGEWQPYLKLNKNDGKSFAFLNEEDFSTFLTLIETAKSML